MKNSKIKIKNQKLNSLNPSNSTNLKPVKFTVGNSGADLTGPMNPSNCGS